MHRIIFIIFAPLFRRKTRQRDFIEKKACFRLSVNVNLDNSFCMYGLRKSSLPIEYFVNQVGLIFQCLTYRESKPYVEDAETIGLHFFVVGIMVRSWFAASTSNDFGTQMGIL